MVTPTQEYFRNQGYEIERSQTDDPNEPEYIIKKDGKERTIDVVQTKDWFRSISKVVYQRILNGGFFVVEPLLQFWGYEEPIVYTNEDIREVHTVYLIDWKRRHFKEKEGTVHPNKQKLNKA